MPNLKLIYFKMRALAEAPQLMLHYSGTPYSYEMGWDYFGQPWSEVKSSVLYRQLPLLVVNESTEIFQSGAITRYLAELTGLRPDDALLLAKVDALYEASQELFRPLNPTINFVVGEEFLSMRIKLIEQLAPRFEDFERILGSQPTTPFFFGDDPFYCDFGVFHHVNLALNLDENLLDPYPFLSEFLSNFERLDGVKEYLDSRPELIGVGSEPQLLINGVAKSTGIVNE